MCRFLWGKIVHIQTSLLGKGQRWPHIHHIVNVTTHKFTEGTSLSPHAAWPSCTGISHYQGPSLTQNLELATYCSFKYIVILWKGFRSLHTCFFLSLAVMLQVWVRSHKITAPRTFYLGGDPVSGNIWTHLKILYTTQLFLYKYIPVIVCVCARVCVNVSKTYLVFFNHFVLRAYLTVAKVWRGPVLTFTQRHQDKSYKPRQQLFHPHRRSKATQQIQPQCCWFFNLSDNVTSHVTSWSGLTGGATLLSSLEGRRVSLFLYCNTRRICSRSEVL